MDFFAHQDAARRRTSLLIFYYAVAVTLLVLATYASVMLVFVWMDGSGGKTHVPLWNPAILGGSVLGTLGVVALGSFWRTFELRRGGSAVAEMLGGRLVTVDSGDNQERQLRNVVEEMAIASGVPVPQIYLLEEERAINAFAAGHTTADAAIGVTRGCVQTLNRDELQGVIAHEFSHILNGDMRMNIRLMGVLHGILCLFIIGRVLLRVRSGSSRKKDSNPLPLLGLLLMLIGSLGVLFGRMIQAAVSRQREFLADASAVQFTRNPNGISGALKKIGASTYGSKLETPQAATASHFFFGNGISESWFGLMATHPALPERIRRIDPTFDGTFPQLAENEWAENPAGTAPPMAQLDPASLVRLAAPPRIRTGEVVPRAGQIVHVRYATELLDSLPFELRRATGDALNATALMFALVLGNSPEIRRQQIELLSSVDGPVARSAQILADSLAEQDSRVRLMLLNLSLPALRTLSRDQWRRYRDALEQLVRCDRQIDLLEFVLKRIIERNIDGYFAPRKATVIQFYSFGPVLRDCALLISALAHLSSGENTEVQRAFHAGASRLPAEALSLVPAANCGLQQIDASITRLAQSVPHIKKTVLEACAHTVACDGSLNANEAELLRAIAESLDCPIPPFVEGV